VKILIWSDAHWHVWNKFGIDNEGMPNRLREQVLVGQQIIEIKNKYKIRYGVFGGDWTHKRGETPTESLFFLRGFLKTISSVVLDGIPPEFRKAVIDSYSDIFYILGADGNHDYVRTADTKEYHKITSILKDYANFVTEIPGLKVRAIAYDENPDWDTVTGYDIVVIHKTPAYVNKYGHAFEGVRWDFLAKNNRIVLFGHHHDPMQLAPNCFVIGSPMPMDFSETGEHGVMILDTDTWKVERIKLKYPEFITVDNSDQVVDTYNYYRVLNAKGDSGTDKVIGIQAVPVFEEKISSLGHKDILMEWLAKEQKPADYFNVIDSIFNGSLSGYVDVYKGVLSKVEVKDFLSLGSVQYEVRSGFIFVEGHNENNPGESNGCGKTSGVGECIYWALTGETTKGLTGDSVIRDTPELQKDARVRLTFTYEGKEIIIDRSRSENLKVIVEGVDKAAGYKLPDQQRILETTFGINEALFMASCYFSQENLQMLTGMTNGDRTNMITDLLGFNIYDDMQEKIKKEVQVCNEDLAKVQTAIVSLRQDIAVKEQKAGGLRESLANHATTVKHHNFMIVQCKDKIVKLQEQLAVALGSKPAESNFDGQLADLYAEKSKIEQEEVLAHNQVSENSSFQKKELRLKKLIADSVANETAITQRIEVERINMQTHINEVIKIGMAIMTEENKAAEYRAEISKAQGKAQGVICPECGNEVTGDSIAHIVGKFEEKVANVHEIIGKLLAQKQQAEAEGSCTNSRLDEANVQLHEVRVEKAGFEQELSNIKALKDDEYSKLLLYKDKINDVQNRINIVIQIKSAYKVKLSEHNIIIVDINNQIASQQQGIKFAEDILRVQGTYVNIMQADLASVEAEIKNKNQDAVALGGKEEESTDKIGKFEFWKVAFSAKGIRSMLLGTFCNQFNQVVSEYAAVVSRGRTTVFLSPQGETKKGEARNMIDVLITNNGKTRTHRALSGGEKRRVDMALCIALNKWVSNRYNLNNGIFGLMIFDELFASLDRTTEETAADLLIEEGKDKAVFVVSHTAELAAYADRILTFNKIGGVTECEG
jgi:DNA repair exonuclease SbcCD ATPase subunit